MMDAENGSWRGTAQQITTEMDATKLVALVEQMLQQMDRDDKPTLSSGDMCA